MFKIDIFFLQSAKRLESSALLIFITFIHNVIYYFRKSLAVVLKMRTLLQRDIWLY